MRPELIIWDWNGTILDDAGLCFQIANRMLQERALKPLRDIAAYRAVFGFPIKEYYRKMGYTYEMEPYEVAADEFVGLYESMVSSCPLVEGALETLTAFEKAGIPQVLLSATKESQLLDQVALFPDLQGKFKKILGLGDHYAVSKQALAEDFMLKAGGAPKNALFIGDTDHDAQVSAAAGSPCVLMTSGHQSRERLGKTGARAVLDSQEELRRYVLGN